MITKCRLSVLTYRKNAKKKIKEKSGKGVIVYLYHKLLNNTEKSCKLWYISNLCVSIIENFRLHGNKIACF
jgi:hypothetical protein